MVFVVIDKRVWRSVTTPTGGSEIVAEQLQPAKS